MAYLGPAGSSLWKEAARLAPDSIDRELRAADFLVWWEAKAARRDRPGPDKALAEAAWLEAWKVGFRRGLARGSARRSRAQKQRALRKLGIALRTE